MSGSLMEARGLEPRSEARAAQTSTSVSNNLLSSEYRPFAGYASSQAPAISPSDRRATLIGIRVSYRPQKSPRNGQSWTA